MNNWNELLVPREHTLNPAELAVGFVAPVTDQGLIAFTGAESATFLHSQLTNDVEHLGQDEVRLAGYCSPKGRLLASFLMWRNEESVFLQLAREIQPVLQKRLQMFVLRAKTKASDAGEGQVVLGLGGGQAQAVLQTWFDVLPAKPYSKIEHPLGTLLRVADAFGAPRYLWLATPETVTTAAPVLAERLNVGGNAAWRLSEIHAGVPQIAAATQEQFVPQMINLELLGGVNFKKGCYPGQEIVARSQYLGKLKRRTALVTVAAAEVLPGVEVFSPADPEQPCGMVVNAAPNGAGGSDALVEMKLDALESAEVRLGAAGGPALQFLPMPYVLDKLDV
ncbi:folate-binding protein YgfZ [Massilia sp. NR 4-1]|uniref:CAF17-like 4Fe-4S cluster assembly/insertion protein YgfZ n=1 Tax=Massilia sp. NR 4-1 TaxID=1678028 RepID=UPI00067D309B|nr:folate-binding protein YgfZ [Massilia sp. NR 4-1]AKU20953.1 folate-binding protein [Massilia sp. NR 4-1]